jgi:nitroreductase
LFKNDPIPNELLLELLNVAIWAPTHGNRQPWRFILYTGEGRFAFANAVIGTYSAEEKEKNGAIRFEYFTTIPAHLLIVMPEDPRQKQWEEDFAAACCLIQNFQLAAWEKGIGVVWKTNNFIFDPRFREAARIQPGEKIVGALHIGYPGLVPEARPRKPAEEMLTVIESS